MSTLLWWCKGADYAEGVPNLSQSSQSAICCAQMFLLQLLGSPFSGRPAPLPRVASPTRSLAEAFSWSRNPTLQSDTAGRTCGGQLFFSQRLGMSSSGRPAVGSSSHTLAPLWGVASPSRSITKLFGLRDFIDLYLWTFGRNRATFQISQFGNSLSFYTGPDLWHMNFDLWHLHCGGRFSFSPITCITSSTSAFYSTFFSSGSSSFDIFFSVFLVVTLILIFSVLLFSILWHAKTREKCLHSRRCPRKLWQKIYIRS